jgi:two-component system nitrate/nitrite response regulator NarL
MMGCHPIDSTDRLARFGRRQVDILGTETGRGTGHEKGELKSGRLQSGATGWQPLATFACIPHRVTVDSSWLLQDACKAALGVLQSSVFVNLAFSVLPRIEQGCYPPPAEILCSQDTCFDCGIWLIRSLVTRPTRVVSLEKRMDTQRPRENRIRVLVADNTRIHTQLLADALKRDQGLDVINADSDSHSLIATAIAHTAEVLVISSNLDEDPQRAFEVLRQLRASHPQIRAVILLDSSKRETILHAFRAGARGIFSRHESVEALCKCVRSVHEGQIWASSLQMSFAVEALASSPTVRAVDANGLNLLSKREMEVVRSLSEGLTNREIAERLGLSQHTIKNYLFRVFDKLGVSSRVELLFMTLSQASPGQQLLPSLLASAAHGNSHDEATLTICQKAAEQGLPTAQLALAQIYSARRAGPKDLVSAYMWFLIANEQITRSKNNVNKTMTMEQLLEAEQRAAEWMRKTRKISPASIEDPPEYGPPRERDATA